jgi:hypothetical protein
VKIRAKRLKRPVGPDIPIEEATAESVSKAIFDREFAWLKREIQGVNKLTMGLLVALLIAFITLFLMVAEMVIESYRYKSGVDQTLIRSLEKQDQLLERILEKVNQNL